MRVTGVKYELLRNFNANSQDLYESMCKLGDQVGQHGLLSGALQPTIVILDFSQPWSCPAPNTRPSICPRPAAASDYSVYYYRLLDEFS